MNHSEESVKLSLAIVTACGALGLLLLTVAIVVIR